MNHAPLDLRQLRHDLRTPVNHILGYCEMVLEDETVPKQFVDELEKIHKGGHRLLNLINEYLSEESFDPSRTNLSQISHDLRTPVNMIIGYCDLIADQADDPATYPFLHDLRRIRSAAQDWLRRMEACLISPPPQAPPSPASEPTVAISQASAPAAQKVNPRRKPRWPIPGLGHATRLLVVDDDQASAELLARRLCKQRIEVVVAEDGKTALDLLDQQTFDGMLLDFVMPGMDGLAVLRQLRKRFTMTEFPVIMVTGKDSSLDVVSALQQGANDYVTKPIDFDVVMARLTTHLGLKAAQAELQDRMSQIQRLARDLESRNEFIRQAFGRYVTDEVVRQILETPQGLQLGGEQRIVTILMSDLRGFTMLAERHSPEEMVATLNVYFGAMVEIIARFQGIVSEFVGDAIVAIFGAPNYLENHAEQAVSCALAMQMAMNRVNRKLRAKGLPELEMGIGLNTGPVIAGNVGSVKRAKYCVVGSPVNLTGRIQAISVGGEILAPDTTIEELRSRLIIRDTVSLTPKGISTPLTLHSLAGLAGRQRLVLPKETSWWAPENAPGVSVECFVITDDKSSANVPFAGFLRFLSAQSGLIQINHPALVRRTDIKIRLLPDPHIPKAFDFYAKIMDTGDTGSDYRLRFTSHPPELAQLLARLATAKIGKVPPAK